MARTLALVALAAVMAALPAAAARQPSLIVFVRGIESDRGQLELFTVRGDGSRVRRLTFDPADDMYPAWSPNGRHVAALGTGGRLMIHSDDGGRREEIPVHAPAGASEIAWSPTGQWVSYLAERCIDPDDPRSGYTTPGCADLWVVRPDTPGELKLVDARVDTLDLAASYSWAPRGGRIVYELQTSGATMLAIVDVETGRKRGRIRGTAGSADPAWSPRADLIAFVRSERRRGHRGVYLVRSDGKGLRALRRQGWAERPSWSPDGRRLAYLVAERSTSGNRWGVWVTRPGGGAGRRIATATENWRLVWSPDSTRLAWVNAFERIVVMRADGRGRPRFVVRGQWIDWR